MLWLSSSFRAVAPLLGSPALTFAAWLLLHHLGPPMALASSFLTGKDGRGDGGARSASQAPGQKGAPDRALLCAAPRCCLQSTVMFLELLLLPSPCYRSHPQPALRFLAQDFQCASCTAQCSASFFWKCIE